MVTGCILEPGHGEQARDQEVTSENRPCPGAPGAGTQCSPLCEGLLQGFLCLYLPCLQLILLDSWLCGAQMRQAEIFLGTPQ